MGTSWISSIIWLPTFKEKLYLAIWLDSTTLLKRIHSNEPSIEDNKRQ